MSRQQWELHDREFSLYDNIERLQKVRADIKRLEVEEAALIDSIICDIGHEHKGERSYQVGDIQVVCKTPVILSLDKKAYEKGDVFLDAAFDPIEQSVAYKVNRSKYLSMMELAPGPVREALNALITEKDGKRNVTIKA
jgi:hypothetical protein